MKILHPGVTREVEVLLSDLRALAKAGLVRADHEDSIFGVVELTAEGIRAADALGEAR